jgi:hypothetical protein
LRFITYVAFGPNVSINEIYNFVKNFVFLKDLSFFKKFKNYIFKTVETLASTLTPQMWDYEVEFFEGVGAK